MKKFCRFHEILLTLHFVFMGRVIAISVVIVLLAVVLLSVRVIFRKDGEFRSFHISESKDMRKRGIGCVQSQDSKARRSSEKMDVSSL